MDVVISTEKARGCGYRKAGKGGVGCYIVGPSTTAPCGRLPFPLTTCPCCGGGIKPARSWQWISPRALFAPSLPPACAALKLVNGAQVCATCPMGYGAPDGRHGLLFIGGAFYKAPRDFMREAAMMGVSRKLPVIPRDFRLGETMVYLAHRHAVPVVPEPGEERVEQTQIGLEAIVREKTPEIEMRPGVFTAFRPTGIDLVIDDEHNVPDRAKRLAEKLTEQGGGEVRLVKVVRDIDTQGDLLDRDDEAEGDATREEAAPC